MQIPDGVWFTTQTYSAYPGRILKTFHCRHPDIRRTHTGAWVRQGRRYSTYALAVAARDRDASWVLGLSVTKAP